MNALRIFILTIALAVSGCGFDFTGWEDNRCYDMTRQQIEEAYLEVEACTGLTYPIPQIIYDTYGPVTALSTPPVIVMNTVWLDEADCKTERSYYKHEFVHALLHYSGFPIEDNKNHQSPLFGICGGA